MLAASALEKLQAKIDYSNKTVTFAALKACIKPANWNGHIVVNVIDGEAAAPVHFAEVEEEDSWFWEF